MNGVDTFSVLGLGFILGLKHALDADHLVAVSTIVSERKGIWSSSIVGMLWGMGHTASLLLAGLLVIAFHLQIPDKVAQGLEFAVALMLILLGGNVLWKIRRGATFHFHVHEHHDHLHVHPHLHEPVEHAGSETPDDHHRVKVGKKPFFVGIVHGMAGSAALMLVVLAGIPSRLVGVLYMGVFGVGSIGGMLLMSTLIGVPFALTAKHGGVNRIVRTTAGIVSLIFGLLLACKIGFVDGLFH